VLGESLLNRLRLAIPEAAKYRALLLTMEELLCVSLGTAKLDEWRNMVEQWENDLSSGESPYKPWSKRKALLCISRLVTQCLTEPTVADTRLALAENDKELPTFPDALQCQVSPSAFIMMGLELEELQSVRSLFVQLELIVCQGTKSAMT
jgi:hypothetical protein